MRYISKDNFTKTNKSEFIIIDYCRRWSLASSQVRCSDVGDVHNCWMQLWLFSEWHYEYKNKIGGVLMLNSMDFSSHIRILTLWSFTITWLLASNTRYSNILAYWMIRINTTYVITVSFWGSRSIKDFVLHACRRIKTTFKCQLATWKMTRSFGRSRIIEDFKGENN